jgi:hypothetical protein
MRTNETAVNKERTHEGGMARTPTPEKQLMRLMATCMLFEDTFYEKGSDIANSIAMTCKQVPVELIAETAIKAREDFKLRHVPLFLVAQLDLRRAEAKGLLSRTVERVVQRPDELAELLSIIQKVNPGKPLKKVISAQVKKGLAKAFAKFNAYQLAKWNRDNTIKLRDVMFLVHAKPIPGVKGFTKKVRKDGASVPEGGDTFMRLAGGTLETPDTWEVALSAGKDKKETWERLIRDEKLGYMALLMNLRNMEQANVDHNLVEDALIKGAPHSRALPFRFISAYKAAPSFAQSLSDAMVKAISEGEKLAGTTYLVLDVSGSMDAPLSSKGQLMRWEAGAALGILFREICERARVFTFSQSLVEVANVRGLGMIEGVKHSQPFAGTYLAGALKSLYKSLPAPTRTVVITDEQAHDGLSTVPAGSRGYLVNVAPNKPALAMDGRWSRISGFSERLVDFIRWEETENAQ